MTSKKDFIKAAEIVRQMIGVYAPDPVENIVADAFVKLFRNDNPKFDEKRFRQACK